MKKVLVEQFFNIQSTSNKVIDDREIPSNKALYDS